MINYTQQDDDNYNDNNNYNIYEYIRININSVLLAVNSNLGSTYIDVTILNESLPNIDN